MKALLRLAALTFAFTAATELRAQQQLIDLVPRRDFTDERGVDLTAAVYRHREELLSIGGGTRRLALTLSLTSPGLVQNAACTLGAFDIGNAIYQALDSHSYFGNTAGTALMTVVLPHQSAKFGVYGQPVSAVVPQDAAHVSASFNPARTQLSYIGGDGTEATLSSRHAVLATQQDVQIWGMTDEVRFPDGETWTYRYNDRSWGGGGCGATLSRVRSIVSNRGYAIQFNYAADDPSGAVPDWVSPVRVTAYNKAVVQCDETLLQSCASVTALSSAVTFSYDRANNRVTITKPNGETVELTFGQLQGTMTLAGVTRPGGVTRTLGYAARTDPEDPVYRYLATLTEAGRTWNYGFSPSSGGGQVAASEPGGATTYYFLGGETPYLILDPLNRQTELNYDGWHRFLRERFPEGNEVTAGYDVRGNLNLVRRIASAGSGLAPQQASAVYPATCAARRSCNQPSSITDRNNNVTDYTYSDEHGGVLTETGPAVNGVRPQVRHEYAQRTAWISSGAGGYVAAAPVWLRTTTSFCRTSAATGNPAAPCATAGDEVRTAYDYGPDSGPNNLLLRGQAVTATDRGVTTTLRTCYGYDVNGRRISETLPTANLASCP